MISDEAVEAGAHALALQAWGGLEYVPDALRSLFLRDARTVLEAAEPPPLAEAWEEGMEAMHESTSHEWPPIPEANPYRRTEGEAV